MLSADAAQRSAKAAKSAAETASSSLKQSEIDSAAQDVRNREAIAASSAQSKAALDASIAASRNDQRAWLAIVNVHLTTEPSAGTELNVIYEITNTGKTPAINVVGKSGVYLQPTEPASPDWSTITDGINRAVVFPNSTSANMRAPLRGITQPSINEYTAHRSNLYVRIRFDYTDVFRKPHWLEVCMMHIFGEPLDRFQFCVAGGDIDK